MDRTFIFFSAEYLNVKSNTNLDLALVQVCVLYAEKCGTWNVHKILEVQNHRRKYAIEKK